MYYGIVVISVLMFGVQFYLSDKYQKENGTGISAVFTFSFISYLVGAICLLVINRFDVSFTPFTLIMAVITALDGVLCTICSLKSLEKVKA